jgi:hexulose-6-phosphate isomerase
MKLGIIQGRLSEPKEGFQECPVDWKREFDLLSDIGLDHIEWIITLENFYSNPIFNEDLREYPISSVCADFMVDDAFCNPNYLNHFLRKTCKAVSDNNISCITIPLLENSSIDNGNTLSKFIEVFQPYTKEFANLNFLIEAELDWKTVKKILDLNDNIFLTYDTGNITSCGFDHQQYLNNCISKIKTIHLKDRTRSPIRTVQPFTGDTDFNVIFKTLVDLQYDGNFTIQTARGTSGKEIQTIKEHKQKFKELYYEKFI